MKVIQKVVAGIVTGIVLLSSATPAAAENLNTTLQQQQSQANSLQNEIETTTAEVLALDSQIADKQSEIDEMKLQIEQTNNEIETIIAEIEETQNIISEKKEEIASLEASQERRIEILRERASTLQKQNRTNMALDILLNSESIVDLLQRASSLGTLFQSDTDIMQELQETQTIIEAEKQILEEKEQALSEQQEALQQKQASLQHQQDELQRQQDNLQASKSQKEAAIASLEANLQSVRNDIATTNARLEEQAAEAARLLEEQRERENRQAAAAASSNNQPATAVMSNAANTSSADRSLIGNNTNNTNNSNTGNANTNNNGNVINIARRYIGVPYRWGGTTPSGFDCSGFVLYVFNQAGRRVPRVAQAQWNASTRISRAQARPGDLVFFQNTTGRSGITHVGIYMGGNQFIHASSSRGITITSLSNVFWSPRVAGFGRI